MYESSICLQDSQDPGSVHQYHLLDSLSVLTLATNILQIAPFSDNHQNILPDNMFYDTHPRKWNYQMWN